MPGPFAAAVPVDLTAGALLTRPAGAVAFDLLDHLDDERLLKVTEVAAIFDITTASVYGRCSRSQMPLPRTRRPTRWRVGDLRGVVSPALGRPKKKVMT